MTISETDQALIHKVASGDAPFDELIGLLDSLTEPDPVYKLLLSDPSAMERIADLEREVISYGLWGGSSFLDFLWDYDHGYLRHRFVAEMMSDRGKNEGWFDRCDTGITKVFHYLLDDYRPEEKSDPSAEEILLYMVKEYDHQYNSSPSMIDFINMGIFDSVSADTKEKVLSFVLSKYTLEDNDPFIESFVLAWIRRGLVSVLPGNCLQELLKWVDSRPNKIDYMEAGLWHLLSTHERAKMIAPFLDKAETARRFLPNLSEFKTLCRLLRLEGDSPLLQETMEELDRINYYFSLYNPNALLQ